jgi:penicillin-binding protein 2
MTRRLLFCYLVLVGSTLIIFLQLFRLQIVHGQRNLALSEGNRIKIEETKAARGILYDRQDRPLVYNIPVKNKIGLSRDYLYNSILAHLIGYVDIDYQGVSGFEKEYNEVLRGIDGGELIEVDSVGQKVRTLGKQDPVPGKNLSLTIDLDWQKKAHEALGNKKGAVIISKPQTGEILALVSRPSFDPNEISEKVLEDFDEPLFNRATSGVYPPGSIFKIVTAAAGLETGKINGNTLILDTGEIRIGQYRYGNWYFDRFGRTEGLLDIVGAIKRSNDIFFYRVAERVGARKLVEWAKAFGLARDAGYLPDPTKEEWFLGNTYHLAIGQGKIGVTPLQVNTMANVIANAGKFCQPKFLKDEAENCQEIGIKKETVAIIKKGMVEACSEGGTSLRFLNLGFPVACKTGTAEFGPPVGGQVQTHAWFTLFAPADDPQISITVLVEAGGGGSEVAAPIAREIMELWSLN